MIGEGLWGLLFRTTRSELMALLAWRDRSGHTRATMAALASPPGLKHSLRAPSVLSGANPPPWRRTGQARARTTLTLGEPWRPHATSAAHDVAHICAYGLRSGGWLQNSASGGGLSGPECMRLAKRAKS